METQRKSEYQQQELRRLLAAVRRAHWLAVKRELEREERELEREDSTRGW